MESDEEKCSQIVFTFNVNVEDSAIESDRLCYSEVDIRSAPHNPWVSLGRTKPTPLTQNLSFTEEFPVTYKFQSQQELRLSLFKIEEEERFLIGHCISDLSKLLGSLTKLTIKDSEVNDTGMFFLRCDEVLLTKQKIIFVLRCEELDDLDTFDKSDPYLMIYRESPGGWVFIERTKTIMNNLNPQWDPIVMDYSLFCHCDPNIMIRIDVFDYDSPTKSEMIGRCNFLAKNFVTGAVYPVLNPEKMTSSKYKGSGRLIVASSELVTENSFIDYIRGGMNLNVTIGIDYTASNGMPTNNNSLHFNGEGHVNEYEAAIRALGKILNNYDSDQRFPVFGFGGIPNWLNEVSHAFALNGNDNDPYINTFEEVINTYKNSLKAITLRGPTHFSQLLRKQMELISNCRENVYHILLIITDGEIEDLDETIELVIEASKMPLSILIVGVGTEHFLKMARLDGDQKELCNKKGEKCARDIIQFVNFRKYKSEMAVFAKEALMEIPTQLMKYMELKRHAGY